MKFGTSFFNPTAFRKNLTRFAPVWGLYTVALFMGLFLMSNSGASHWLFRNLADSIQTMSAINLCYALICAQLLFGDLYNARMCNMLHALPIRREGWFTTHVVSGLVFSFGPTALMTLAALALVPLSEITHAWQIPLYWLLGTNLEFLFFFGVATLAAFCVGSRFAQAVVYAIVNFASLLVWFLVDTLYTPLLYGIQTQEIPYLRFCPVYTMADSSYMDVRQIEVFQGLDRYGHETYSYYGEFTIENGWWYLFLCAAIGLALMILALRLYQKRRLETAGDFIAISALEPVFLVIYTMVVGTCFHFVFQEMMGYHNGIFFNFVGLAVGWFTGKMFLERRVNVFHRKTFAGLGVLVAIFLASIGIVYMDPLGLETWVPDAEDVKSVYVGAGHGTYQQSSITLDSGDIETIIGIHYTALDKRINENSREVSALDVVYDPVETDSGVSTFYETVTQEVVYKEMIPIKLVYTLNSGITRSRYYYVYAEDEDGQILDRYFSSPEAVFGIPRDQMTSQWLNEFAEKVDGTGASLEALQKFIVYLTQEEKVALLQAVLADCEAGTMTQHYGFRRNDMDLFWLGWQDQNRYMDIQVSLNDVNAVKWLESHGFDIEEALKAEYDEEYLKEYGYISK